MPKAGGQSVDNYEVTRVLEALREVIDPDTGVDIVDLGLIYAVEATEHVIRVRMTMTTPFSPLGGLVADEVERVLAQRFPGRGIDVDLVWQPRWQPGRISAIVRPEPEMTR